MESRFRTRSDRVGGDAGTGSEVIPAIASEWEGGVVASQRLFDVEKETRLGMEGEAQ
jgi:hypothetical protein